MTRVSRYKLNTAANTDRNRSPNIWADCPLLGIQDGTVNGISFFDDFENYGLPGTQTTEINLGRYKVYCASAGKWIFDDMPHTTTPAGGMGGIISGLCDTDEDTAVIGTQACPFSLSTTATGKLWFEARIATTSILTATTSLFVGLAENVAMAFGDTVPIDDDDATTATGAMIGFNRLNGGLGVLNFSYADHAAVWTDIQAACNASPLTQLAANTFIKVGFKVNPADSAGCVRAYINNQETSTPMTKAALLALTHLDAKGLGPCLAMAAGASGTAAYTYLDWWGCVQTY